MPTKSRRRLVLFSVLAAGLVLLAQRGAQAQAQVTADIYEFGIYTLGPITAAEPPTDYGVERLFGDRIDLLESTHEIPGQVGVSFGIRYVLHSGGTPTVVPVSIVVRYPPQGLYNPERPGPSYFDQHDMVRLTEEESFITWDFMEQWHIEPGIWTVEIWSGGEKLDEEWFEVITPPIS
jgi:hypothetical protein